ncbi:RHS repeat-associated core domain-containing protein [Mesoterricola silvestris]|uniref:RHS repeat-associated core domain-containing protein n=1 Tax=Mesoterricola silvestris TaxID=2927979 RepID=A0AA48GFZ1_9BACT|nr:RHS repeat-associated core domain-containing protein [Mesoterricola silvestris]BDU72026.1 hypothetical protein METEAL_12000 [Mesoterricola silvestris]
MTRYYTYDRHPEFLDPARTTSVRDVRSDPSGPQANPPTQSTTFDATTFLPLGTYLDGGSSVGQIGRAFTYASSGNLSGHLQTVTNYATGAVFSAAGVATQTCALDPATALPSSLSVTYDGPAGYTNAFSNGWTAYDTADRPTTSTDGLGVVTQTTYDGRGRVTTLQRGGQSDVTFTYPSETTWTSTQNLRNTVVNLDAFGRVKTRLRGVDGVTEICTYDGNGNPASLQERSSAGNSRVQARTFDGLGRLKTHTPLRGPMVTYSYSTDSSGGQVTSIAYSGQSFTTSTTQDCWGQTVASTDPYATVTTTRYDAMGHVVSLTTTPAGLVGQTRTFTYNAAGLLVNRTSPETGTTTFGPTFNQLGLPLTVTEGTGRARTISYDGLGRIRTVVNGTDQAITHFNGLRISTCSTTSAGQASSIQYTLDDYGRLQAEQVLPPGATTPWNQSYTYDSAGRMRSVTYPDGRIVGYVFDDTGNFGRTTSVTVNGATFANVTYDEFGWGNRRTLTFVSTGSSNTWEYTSDGTQLSSQTVNPVGSSAIVRNYAYDALNHLNQAGEWASLSHDFLGRLTSASGDGVSATFSHDGYGNNTYSQAGSAAGFNNFAYLPLPSNRATASDTSGAATGWSYNANGEALTAGTALGSVYPQLGLAWDGLDRLSSSSLPGFTESYGYLPNGLRVQRLNSADPSQNRRYAYAFTGNLLAEYTGSGNTWSWLGDIVYLGSQAIAEFSNAGTLELHADHLGTPKVLTSGQTGALLGIQAFGPFGEPRGSYLTLTGYTGHQQADSTGLIYMRGRFYSPAWHRFLNSDQGADPNQPNQYAYCGGSPFMLTDPSGLDSSGYWVYLITCNGAGIYVSTSKEDAESALINYQAHGTEKYGSDAQFQMTGTYYSMDSKSTTPSFQTDSGRWVTLTSSGEWIYGIAPITEAGDSRSSQTDVQFDKPKIWFGDIRYPERPTIGDYAFKTLGLGPASVTLYTDKFGGYHVANSLGKGIGIPFQAGYGWFSESVSSSAEVSERLKGLSFTLGAAAAGGVNAVGSTPIIPASQTAAEVSFGPPSASVGVSWGWN